MMRVQAFPAKHALAVFTEQISDVLRLVPDGIVLKDTVGDSVVAVPHHPDVVNLLTQSGVENIPHPMTTFYPFPGRFKPFDAQRATADFATMHDRCFILNSMGLGKTMTSLWAFDFLRSIKKVNKLLVVCPLSTMERTWGDEIFQSFPQYKVNVLHGTSARRKKLLADTEADIYIINTDGISIIQEELANRDDIDLVIIDEVALFRNQSTTRWKVMNKICNKQTPRKVWGMTGSPTPNLPTDAWAQCKLVTPSNPDLPKYFSRFRDETMLKINMFKWLPKPNAPDLVFKIMQPSIRFSLDDCLDLPPQTVTSREVPMTKEQDKAYKDMFNKLVFELKGQEVNAVNEAIKAGKLLQICSGVAYDNMGQEVILPMNPRLECLKEIVEESEGKVIVFVPFTGAIHAVVDYLRENEVSTEIIDGSVGKNERDRIFGTFQNSPDIRVIVANPAAMSHGLTLTAATTIVWYGPTYSNEVYQQACARVRRPGQKRTTVIVHMVSSPLERSIYQRLDKKQSLQGALLDLVADTSNENLRTL